MVKRDDIYRITWSGAAQNLHRGVQSVANKRVNSVSACPEYTGSNIDPLAETLLSNDRDVKSYSFCSCWERTVGRDVL